MIEPYTARDGMRDPETLARFERIRRQAGQRDPAHAAELVARASAMMTRDAPPNVTSVGSEPGDPDTADVLATVHLRPEFREPWLICQMCTRTMRKKKGGRVEVRPNVLVCPTCADLPQTVHPVVCNQWLADYPDYKRHAVAAKFRVDPAELTAAVSTTGESTEFYSDVDGRPLAVISRPVMAQPWLVPVRTFFDWLGERGRGVL